MLTVLGGIALGVGIITLRARVAFGLGAVVIFSLLTAATALSIPGLGSIQPAHVLLGFVVIKVLIESELPQRVVDRACVGRAEQWLILTVVLGVAGAVFLPRVFAGQVLVNPVRSSALAEGVGVLPLEPTGGNITQSVYFAGDVVLFLVVAAFIRDKRSYVTIASIYLAYCAANIGFAVLDWGTAKTGTAALLTFMRNSTYAVYETAVVEGLQRVKGSFTEASAFATATIGPFCYTGRLFLGGVRPRLCGSLAVLSAVFILLSTSSTGYAALVPCVAILYGGSLVRLARHQATRQDVAFAMFGPLLTLGALLQLFMSSETLAKVTDLLDSIFFNKSASQSGLERAAMNREGLRAFADTFYLGAGIGSVRASSLIVAALSNLGIVGSIAYAMFHTNILLRANGSLDDETRTYRSAARCAVVGTLVAACLSAALIDLGLAYFVLTALAYAPQADPERSSDKRASVSLRPAVARPVWGRPQATLQ